MEISQVILFCKDKESSEKLNNELTKLGFISSNLNEDKEKIISNFKNGYIRIIIFTSEDSINEIDIYQDNLIINYDLPSNIDEFIKRIGRNESFSKKGIVINFVTENDNKMIKQLEDNIKEKIEELPLELSIINENK
jgi:superfamily II DNA/RNA helicase